MTPMALMVGTLVAAAVAILGGWAARERRPAASARHHVR